MATANFHSRIARIQKAHAQESQPQATGIRAPGIAGIAASNQVKRRSRHPLLEHLVSTALGIVLGCLVAVALIGLSREGTPWGPGSPWHEIAYYPIMGGLALAPVLMILSLFVAARRPPFALFSLGYLSGIVIPLFS